MLAFRPAIILLAAGELLLASVDVFLFLCALDIIVVLLVPGVSGRHYGRVLQVRAFWAALSMIG